MKVKIHQHVNESEQLVEKLSSVITVHEFYITEEDHDIYAAEPLLAWEYSESGRWIIEHAVDPPVFLSQMDYTHFSHKYIIRARLHEEDITFYQLKWGNK